MIEPYQGIWPKIGSSTFVHKTAVLIGKVEIGEDSSVWPCTTLRGDDGRIIVGKRTSIQDGSVVHLTGGWSETFVGDECTVGHNVILHGCKVGNQVLVGMGAIILDNAEIGELCLIGAGALITANTKIPPRSLVLGSPAKVIRPVSDKDIAQILGGVEVYVQKAREYLAAQSISQAG